MQWTQPTGHPDDAPHYRLDGKLPDDFVVVSRLFLHTCSLELTRNPNSRNEGRINADSTLYYPLLAATPC